MPQNNERKHVWIKAKKELGFSCSVGYRSAVLIVILVLGILFSMFYASEIINSANSIRVLTKPTLSEEDALNIAKQNLDQEAAPYHVDKFVSFSKYYGHPQSLVFIHDNGTQYYINTTNGYPISDKCIDCNFSNITSSLKGHLFYLVDGSWQDSSVKNCSPFVYMIEANSGKILWSYVGDVKDRGCQVKPPDW